MLHKKEPSTIRMTPIYEYHNVIFTVLLNVYSDYVDYKTDYFQTYRNNESNHKDVITTALLL